MRITPLYKRASLPCPWLTFWLTIVETTSQPMIPFIDTHQVTSSLNNLLVELSLPVNPSPVDSHILSLAIDHHIEACHYPKLARHHSAYRPWEVAVQTEEGPPSWPLKQLDLVVMRLTSNPTLLMISRSPTGAGRHLAQVLGSTCSSCDICMLQNIFFSHFFSNFD